MILLDLHNPTIYFLLHIEDDIDLGGEASLLLDISANELEKTLARRTSKGKMNLNGKHSSEMARCYGTNT